MAQLTMSVTGNLLFIRQVMTLVEMLGDDDGGGTGPLLSTDDILTLFHGLADDLENEWYDEVIGGIKGKDARTLAQYLRRLADRFDPS